MAFSGQLEVAVSTSGRSHPSWRGFWLPPGHDGHSLTFEVAESFFFFLGHFELVVLEKDLTRRVQTPAGGHCHRRNITWAQNYEFRRHVPASSPSCRRGRPGNTTPSFVTLKASAPLL